MHQYPYLPEGRDIKYVPVTDPFMAEAKNARENLSSEMNHPTGAVVVLNNNIVGRAGNQAGIRNKKFQELHKKGVCVRKWLKVQSGKKYWLCPGCAKFSDHAEAGAVRDALKNIGSINGADLYLYGHWWCCKPCWDAMIGAGIKDVYLVDNADYLFR
jgi:tRNA(Arg) A34 adenosine deaminase TadA